MAVDPHKRAPWFRYSDAASVGIEMVVAITLCALGALWLERNVTHWSPWTSILGILVGIGAAAKAVMRAARTAQANVAKNGPSHGRDDVAEDRHDDAR